MSSKNDKEHSNPLFNNTKTDFAPAPGWATPAIEKKEETTVQTQAVAPPAQPPTPVQNIPQSVELPPAPQARRTNRKMRFTELYETRSLSLDKRLLPYFDDLMERGANKTVVANQWVLKMLLDAGYQIDPQILTKPVIKPE